MQTKIIYEEKQSMYYLLVVIFLINIGIAGIVYAQDGFSVSILGILGFAIVFTILLGMLFAFMKITITETQAQVKFGIGLFKRVVPVAELDIENATIEDVGLVTGIGYRYTSKGVLFNSSLGKAVFIPNTSGGHNFNVGSDHVEEIIAAIKQAQKS